MKKLIFILVAAGLLLAQSESYAQTTATSKAAASEEPTAANMLKWAKETLPKMEPLVPKLQKIKAGSDTKASSDALKLLATVTQLKEVKAKGTRLKATEAKRYYDLISATVNSFYIECKSQDNGVCCVDCHNHGILGVWCFANCFVARFPGID